MTPGRKDDGTDGTRPAKLRFDLIHADVITEITRAMMVGADEYGDDNYMRVPRWRRRYFAAALRHLWSWFGGELRDPATGLSHLAHAGACILILLKRQLVADRRRRVD